MPMGTFPPGSNQTFKLCHPTGPDNSYVVASGRFSMVAVGGPVPARGHIFFVGTADPAGGAAPGYLHDEPFELALDVRKVWGCPANTDSITVHFDTASGPVGWCLELAAK
jgi:hypothetical protein